MKKLIIALTVVSFAVAPAMADKCRDPKTGRAAKCDTPGAVPFSAKASTSTDIVKGKDGRCRWAKKGPGHNGGQITKCA